MRIKEVKTFTKGTINSIEDHSIPDGAASDSKNWLTKGDKIELRRGYKVLGTEASGTGSIDGLHVTFKADGTQILYRKRGRKLEYYDEDNPSLVLDQSQASQFDFVDLGYTSQPKLAQTFQPTISAVLGKFQVVMQKVASPTDNLQLEIYSDNSGSIGTLLATSALVDGSTLTSGGFGSSTTVNFLFTAGPSLTADTTYWAVVSRTGSLDAVNYYRVFTSDDDPDPYTRGDMYYYNGTIWQVFGPFAGFYYNFVFNQYYENSWVEVGTNLFPVAATNDEASFANYASLAGNQMFICSPNSGPYKVMTANPGDYADQYVAAANFKGKIKIKQNRTFLWNRNEDKTGIYGSWVDAAAYTTVTGEATTSLTGTLAFKAGGARRTCFAVAITITATGEVYTDNYNGELTGSLGGTGTINYMTGAYTLSNAGVGTANYQWEDSASSGGIMDFSKSSPRTAGQGFIFRQDDGGGDVKSVESYGDTEYCLHRLKTWALTITSTDTNATNLIYRENVGIPNWRAAVATGDGIYFIDDYDQTDPKFRLLTLNNVSTQVIPVPISDALNLKDYRFDKGATVEFGEMILFACRYKDSTENDTVFVYDKRYKSFDRLDYNVSCFAKYNGALVAGDSISDNVFELFSGFDDNGSNISNYWEGNLSDLQIQELKRVMRFWVQGEISRDQTEKIYMAFDRGSYVLVGTQNGTDSNVDTAPRPYIGSDSIGESSLGGTSEISVYNYIKDIKLRQGKFNHVKVRIEATGIGYVSVSTLTYHDIILHGQRLPSKYRAIS